MADDHASPKPTREDLLARITAPADEAGYRAWVQIGLDDAVAGRTVPIEEVRRWAKSLSTGSPLPRPRSRPR